MGIFDKRIQLKPYEYPELLQFKDAIRHSYWIHTEYNLTQDVQDYYTKCSPTEQHIIRNTMLAIAQIEVSVKTFWGDVYSHIPKPEVGEVGYTFAESEVRHSNAYSHLLEILGLNNAFNTITQEPAIADRVSYLSRYLEGAKSRSNKDYTMSLLLFSMFIEHVSLFSQFLIMMSFKKYRNTFKGISNIVQATSKEEQIHGMFGINIINIIKNENPDWFDESTNAKIVRACKKAYAAEVKVLDWIFDQGELEFLSKHTIECFIQHRFNASLQSIGIGPAFEVSSEDIESVMWFDEELLSGAQSDFFDERPVAYAKNQAPVTADDLFD